MQKSELINELASALSKVQGELQPAIKDSENPFFKSRYSSLTEVWNSCRELLSKNGLSVVQTNDIADESVVVETTLLHNSGQWISGRLQMKPVKNDPQGIGSCITYARRYSLAAIVGIVSDEDDDGNAATHAKPAKSEPPKTYTSVKIESAKKRMFEVLKEAFKDAEIKMFAVDTGLMTVAQTEKGLELWPDSSVPKNKVEMDALMEKVKLFHDAGFALTKTLI